MMSTVPLSYFSPRNLCDKSMIVPGSRILYSARNTSANTTRCCAVLNGAPNGWPNGHLRNMVLGGLTCSEYSRTIDTPIVGIPSFSISRCINPTDWLQMPHPGVRRTMSTLSFFNRSATSGALLLISVGMCLPVIWPMNP